MEVNKISHGSLMKFSRILDDTTNSYKIVFLQSLINLIEECDIHAPVVISLRDVAVEMGVVAWYPHKFFRLSLGAQDKLSFILDKIDASYNNLENKGVARKGEVRFLIEEQYEYIGLQNILRYVPYRLLSPFFEQEMKGQPDHKKNSMIKHLSFELYNTSSPPLYRFLEGVEGAIEVHPLWVDYILSSLPIVKGWIRNIWVHYLQARNTSVPAIVDKVYIPVSRSSLSKQRRYWSEFVHEREVKCIYSNELMSSSNYSLDHFVPWSFVCHDQLWNLTPVHAEVNSSKGNCLPAKKYVSDFVSQQLELICYYRELSIVSEKRGVWSKYKEPYVADLGVKESELDGNDKVVHDKLTETLERMLYLAAQNGFTPNWEFG